MSLKFPPLPITETIFAIQNYFQPLLFGLCIFYVKVFDVNIS